MCLYVGIRAVVERFLEILQPFSVVEQGNYHVILHSRAYHKVSFMIADTLIFSTE